MNVRYLLWCSLLLTTCMPPAPKADMVLYNATIFSADPQYPDATAVAVVGGRILSVGSDVQVLRWAGPQTEKRDLHGAFLMPGLIEGHGHFAAMGKGLEQLNLLQAPNWPAIVAMVAERAQTTPAGAWIYGRGWHQDKWDAPPRPAVDAYPCHDALSAAVPDIPVVLAHASGHALLANARAMALAGVTASTPDPPGGRIVRNPNGAPVGVFEENAMALIEKPLADWENGRSEAEKRADFERIAARAAQHCLQHGITSFQDAGSTFEELAYYRDLAEAGKLPVRLWAMMLQPGQADTGRMGAYPVIDAGQGFFTCRAVKAYLDGALGSYGAWLLEPYADKPDLVGQVVTPVDTLALLAEQCRRRGLQFCVHAIGDRANRELLNLYERVLGDAGAGYGQGCPRWRVEHAQHVHPHDQGRFAALGVIASVQAVHCTSDAPFVPTRLGSERASQNAYAWRAFLDQGARIANGTDVPVEAINPMANLYAAVTRRSPTAGVFPGGTLTREEALLAYTLWNAWAAFEETHKGSITPGKMADFTVLSENLLLCDAEKILQTEVRATCVNGKWLFSAK
ncbi:MAG: amidohydrolase family protein [Saprospiraceae bacterium]|nr:amidohydrolase family protein [Saprospiraceae bacterium]